MSGLDHKFADPGIDRKLANAAKSIAEKNLRQFQDEPVPALESEKSKDFDYVEIKEDDNTMFKNLLKGVPPSDNFLILDIETAARVLPQEFETALINDKVKRLVKKDIIEKNIQEFKESYALSPRTGKVILTGMIDQNKKVSQFGLEEVPISEKLLLEKTFELIYDNYSKGGMLITFYGKGFDLPFLISRALQLNCDIEEKIPRSLLGKYSKIHLDLTDYFEGSLAKLSYILGLDENFESEGGLIPGWYENKEYQKIRRKNEADLYNTLGIVKKLGRMINLWA